MDRRDAMTLILRRARWDAGRFEADAVRYTVMGCLADAAKYRAEAATIREAIAAVEAAAITPE